MTSVGKSDSLLIGQGMRRSLVNDSGGVCGTEPRLDATEEDGVNDGVANGVGTTIFPEAEDCWFFFCFLDTHGVPCSSCTYSGAISLLSQPFGADHSTYQIEVNLVFEQVETLHDVLVAHQAQ